MFSFLKGWLKLYLFYGALFFLLGLFGYLGSNDVRLAKWSSTQFKNVMNILARVNTLSTQRLFHWTNNTEELPVFSEQSGKIFLFTYPKDSSDDQLNYLINKVQDQLQTDHKQVIIAPLTDLTEWDNYMKENLVQSFPWILVGFDQIKTPAPIDNGKIRCRLYFSLPNQSLSPFLTKLIGPLSDKLFIFTIHKYEYTHANLWELYWDESVKGESISADVINIFLNTLAESKFLVLAGKNLD